MTCAGGERARAQDEGQSYMGAGVPWMHEHNPQPYELEWFGGIYPECEIISQSEE